MFQHIIYLNCTEAVTDNHLYVDTAPCIHEHPNGHIYAIAGDFLVGSVKAECNVKQVAASSLWGAYDVVKDRPKERSFSYREIHKGLAYGFEVSWMGRACKDFNCGDRGCFFAENFKVKCGPTACDNDFGPDICGKLFFFIYILDNCYILIWSWFVCKKM